MKLSSVAPVLALSALAQCSFLDLETILGTGYHLIPDFFLGEQTINEPAAVASKSAADVIAQVSGIVGNVLGKIPSEAEHAWQLVLDQVPNGATKLADAMKLEAQRLGIDKANANIPAPFRPGSKHGNPSDKGDWLYRVNDERFPDHSLRIKSPTELGLDTVNQYSGYLDVEDEDKHFFFWFFESRSDPENDPVVLWLNGGPGCSSLTGLLFELGPSFIGPELKPIHNKNSWNNKANVIFLDQPVNVGYSYSSSQVSNSVTAGEDTFAFLELFFKQFPQYASSDFHIAGESYAGHYIPAFAAEIESQPDKNFNLTSVLIGNGITDPLIQDKYYQPMACGEGGYPSVLSEEECQTMLDKQPICENLTKACYQFDTAWVCTPAAIYCSNAAMEAYQKTGLNVYDIREPCRGEPEDLCYPETGYIGKYLNQPEVMEALGVSADVEKYVGCNSEVGTSFLFNGDNGRGFQNDVSLLLDLGVPVLLYAGDKDYICNWLGNQAWSLELPWQGQEEFSQIPLSKWYSRKGHKAYGEVRNYEHLTFLRVYDAGHMVPMNQGASSFEMLDRWLSGDFTFA